LKNLEVVGHLTELTYLAVLDSPVRDLKPLAGLTKLKDIAFDKCPLESIEPLAKLQRLEKVQLTNVSLRDISPLANLPALKLVMFTNKMKIDPEQALALREVLPDLKITGIKGVPYTQSKGTIRFCGKDIPLDQAKIVCRNWKVPTLRVLERMKSLKILDLMGIRVRPHEVRTLEKTFKGLEVIH
jgi:Leucine-rich repeat (LRR) protein